MIRNSAVRDEQIQAINSSQSIKDYRTLALKSALSLEVKGMKRRGRSAYAMVKDEFGFRGNKQKVFDQLQEYVDENILRK
jgi:hypothetical protein|tara:strand:+ start:378 stop:617 length:240 start_codon:yes stop_codon:yes gene_type:complete